MKPSRRFTEETLGLLEKSKVLRIRAGATKHKFIGIWFVVVETRIAVRSWSIKPCGWYRTFLRDPQGAIQLGKLEIAVHAMPAKNKKFRDAVDQAYLEKYSTPGALKYAQDLCQPKSRATTMELLPVAEPT